MGNPISQWPFIFLVEGHFPRWYLTCHSPAKPEGTQFEQQCSDQIPCRVDYNCSFLDLFGSFMVSLHPFFYLWKRWEIHFSLYAHFQLFPCKQQWHWQFARDESELTQSDLSQPVFQPTDFNTKGVPGRVFPHWETPPQWQQTWWGVNFCSDEYILILVCSAFHYNSISTFPEHLPAGENIAACLENLHTVDLSHNCLSCHTRPPFYLPKFVLELPK